MKLENMLKKLEEEKRKVIAKIEENSKYTVVATRLLRNADAMKYTMFVKLVGEKEVRDHTTVNVIKKIVKVLRGLKLISDIKPMIRTTIGFNGNIVTKRQSKELEELLESGFVLDESDDHE